VDGRATRMDPRTESKFVRRKRFGQCPMGDVNWTEHPCFQSDFVQILWGYKESCINIWQKYESTWNDKPPCEFKHCFGCETRS